MNARGPAWAVSIFLIAALASACGIPRVARVPVPQEDILKANNAAREADLSFARRDYYAALIKYLEASRLNPNSEYIYNKLGITYSQLKFFTEAGSAFRRSIGLNQKYPYAYNNLGSVYFATNEKGKAERFYRKAISLDPNVASFHINLGTLYFEKNKFEKGMEEWRKGLQIDPQVLSKSEAVSLVAAGSQTAPVDRYYFMARLHASLGDIERTLENLQLALNNGFTDLDDILVEPDFDPVRKDEKFKAFLRTATLLLRP